MDPAEGVQESRLPEGRISDLQRLKTRLNDLFRLFQSAQSPVYQPFAKMENNMKKGLLSVSFRFQRSSHTAKASENSPVQL